LKEEKNENRGEDCEFRRLKVKQRVVGDGESETEG
jgi:hypothetical protein